jgi:hypothetical protein
MKLNAYENDILLTNTTYTIFVEQDEENDILTADIFMPKADRNEQKL